MLIQDDAPYLSFTWPGKALAMSDIVDPSRMGAQFNTLETHDGVKLYWASSIAAICDTLAEVNVLLPGAPRRLARSCRSTRDARPPRAPSPRACVWIGARGESGLNR